MIARHRRALGGEAVLERAVRLPQEPLVARMASGLTAAIRAASVCAAASGSSTTRVTSPTRSASAASTVRPV